MKKENSTKPLVELGLTDLESEIYIFLIENSPATGYRIANRINKPTANTYKALRSMLIKGVVIGDDRKPQAFRSVPVDLLLERLEKRFHKMKSLAAAELSNLKPAADDEMAYRLVTAEQVYERLREMLRHCEKIMLLDIFPSALAELEDDIAAAAGRGVNVLLKLYQPAEVPGCLAVVEPSGAEIMARWPGVGVNGIVDGREHLIAFLAGAGPEVHDALWSRNTVISANYHGALLSEIMLLALGEVLEGRNIKLPNKYLQIRKLKKQSNPGNALLLQRYCNDKYNQGERK
jgi:HTH-type transcriptional regulator, sugar sensing transcriptional regulator